jgi:hypothetical protein
LRALIAFMTTRRVSTTLRHQAMKFSDCFLLSPAVC